MLAPHILLTNKKRGWDGEATMVAELATRLVDRGFRVSLATNPQAKILDHLDGKKINVLGLTLLKEQPQVLWTLPRDMHKLATYVRKEGVDLVHSHASFDTWTAALALHLYRLPVPLLRTKHNVKDIRRHGLNRWYFTQGIDQLIAVSRTVERELLDTGFISRDRVHWVPNGIASDRLAIYEHEKLQARQELKLASDDEVVAYVSRVTRRKDPGTLVKAFVRLAERRPKARLLIVGGCADEGLRKELEALSAGHPRIEFWGFRDDVPRILAAIDLFVLPALKEAFGLAPLEAMAQSVPVVVSDAEGFRDFIDHEQNGLSFPKGDVNALAATMERVLADTELRERFAREGPRTVQSHFTAEQMVTRTIKVYEQSLGRGAWGERHDKA